MVKVLITSDTRYPVNRKVVRGAVEGVFEREKIRDLDAEVSVSVVGSRKMKEIADKYMADGKVHEVLSFPLEEINSKEKGGFANSPDGILRLGDVIVSWPEILRLAALENIMVDEKLAFLVAHGVEHLLGKHHEE